MFYYIRLMLYGLLFSTLYDVIISIERNLRMPITFDVIRMLIIEETIAMARMNTSFAGTSAINSCLTNAYSANYTVGRRMSHDNFLFRHIIDT